MVSIAGLRPPHPPATPSDHTHQPRPLATPTSHTHRQTYLLHPPATSITHMTHVSGGWVCQVGVSGGRVRWVWHTYLTHPSATPTCYSSSHFHVSSDSCVWWMVVSGGRIWQVCQVGVSGRCIRQACQVGVSGGCVTPICHTHLTHLPPSSHSHQSYD